jgi:two-component system, NarL family, nitrate/nitrite response regulator NarL
VIRASVMIVDDHRLFADVVASALSQLGARIIGPVGTAAEALAAASEDEPDVVLLDLGLPDLHGSDAGRLLLARHPDIEIVVLSASTDPRAAAEAVASGFLGFLPKESSLATVVEAIRSAVDGRPMVIPSPRALPRSNARPGRQVSPLTAREQQVLQLIVAARGSRAIADELHISANTVRTHVQSILTKLQVHTRLEAAAFALRHGLVEHKRGAAVQRPRSVGANVVHGG